MSQYRSAMLRFDTNLTAKGLEEAKNGGRALKVAGYKFDIAFTSALTRTQVTVSEVLLIMEQTDIPVQKTWRFIDAHRGRGRGKGRVNIGPLRQISKDRLIKLQ
jgi:bisphosphoglycerate-dependent phosphoglycerate mutase